MDLLPNKFNALARYNDEVAHGLLHSEEYKRQMKRLQEEYNEWLVEEWPKASHEARKK